MIGKCTICSKKRQVKVNQSTGSKVCRECMLELRGLK